MTLYRHTHTHTHTHTSYKLYKEIHGLEEYLLNLIKHNRVTVSNLRASNNRFPINVGRYQNVPREARLCNKCDDNLLGDEYHVLLVCQNDNIVRLREMYIPRFYRIRPTYMKFKLLM